MRTVLIAIVALAIALLVAAAALYSFLNVDAFRTQRVQLAAERFSELLRYPVEIDGDVEVSLLPRIAIVATDLRISSDQYSQEDRAALGKLRVFPNVQAIFGDGMLLPEMEATDLILTYVQEGRGVSNWTKRPVASDHQAERSNFRTIVDVLGERDVAVTNAEVILGNVVSGFEFAFALDSFEISQGGAQRTTQVTTHGTLNAETFEVRGDFFADKPYRMVGQIGAQSFELDGRDSDASTNTNFAGELVMVSDDLNSLMRVLKLNGEFAGLGTLEAVLSTNNGRLRFEDVDIDVELANGHKGSVDGWLHSQADGENFDLLIKLDVPGKQQVSAATYVRDIRAAAVEAQVVGTGDAFEIVDINFYTNAFDTRLQEIGPFRIGNISRTPLDDLQVTNFTLELGPPESPYFSGTTDIGNLLELKDFEVSAKLDLPPEVMLTTLSPSAAAPFGRLVGSLDLSGSLDQAIPMDVKLWTSDGTIWSSDARIHTPDLLGVQGFSGHTNTHLNNSTAFFAALGRQLPNVGELGFNISFKQAQSELMTEADISFGNSSISANLGARIENGTPALSGSVHSSRAAISNLKDGMRAANELVSVIRSLGQRRVTHTQEHEFKPLVLPEKKPEPKEDLSDFQPLVIDQLDEAHSGNSVAHGKELSDFQPLVIEDEEVTNPDHPRPEDEDLTGFQPLVISEESKNSAGLGNSAGIGSLRLDSFGASGNPLKAIEADIAVDIKRLTGQQGLTYVSSRLRFKDGRMRFGPLDVAYGGGRARVNTSVNVVDTPGWVRLIGNAGGWQLNDVIAAFGVDASAAGNLNATFDLAGRMSSVQGFANTMRGRASVELKNGRIGTSLIELAGLGVIPWLFSKEQARGYSNIVCLKMPLTFDRGYVASRTTVLETERVQLVAKGSANWRNDQISVRVEPRPVGRPMARSAFPFTISGRLSNPQVKKSASVPRRPGAPLALAKQRVPCVPDYRQTVEPVDVP